MILNELAREHPAADYARETHRVRRLPPDVISAREHPSAPGRFGRPSVERFGLGLLQRFHRWFAGPVARDILSESPKAAPGLEFFGAPPFGRWQYRIVLPTPHRATSVAARRAMANSARRSYLVGMSVDLFEAGRDEAALHPQFKTLRDSPLYEPARGLLREISATLTDPDGNLIEQFQTHGFDARTFEIFLFALFTDAGHDIDRSNERPDFLLRRDGISVAVEAVTANPPPSPVIKPYSPVPKGRNASELSAYLSEEVAIRFGSPLYTKLKKRYWELPQVAGRPFVLAVETFHEQGSLIHSSSALGSYLFGLRQKWFHDETGRLVITPTAIDKHRSGAKEIPSGFFNQPDVENVSAVLFCNSGTVPKFNRMGQQGAHRSPNVRMLRYGTCYSWMPEASKPEPFVYEVGDPSQGLETWGEGAVVFHNPNASRPLPAKWLGASSEERLEGSNICATILADFHPYMSMTLKFPGDVSTSVMQREHDRLLGELSAIFPVPRDLIPRTGK